MADDKKEKWLHTPVDDTLYSAMCEVANKLGMKESLVQKMAFEEFVVSFVESGKNASAMVMVEAARIKHKNRENQIDTLRRMVSSYLEDPDEDRADYLQKLCEASEVSMEKLIANLDKAPQLREVLKTGQSLSKAEAWLLENLELDKVYAQTAVINMGAKAGFKEHTLKNARKTLKANTNMEVISFHEGKPWFWKLVRQPVESEQEEQ